MLVSSVTDAMVERVARLRADNPKLFTARSVDRVGDDPLSSVSRPYPTIPYQIESHSLYRTGSPGRSSSHSLHPLPTSTCDRGIITDRPPNVYQTPYCLSYSRISVPQATLEKGDEKSTMELRAAAKKHRYRAGESSDSMALLSHVTEDNALYTEQIELPTPDTVTLSLEAHCDMRGPHRDRDRKLFYTGNPEGLKASVGKRSDTRSRMMAMAAAMARQEVEADAKDLTMASTKTRIPRFFQGRTRELLGQLTLFRYELQALEHCRRRANAHLARDPLSLRSDAQDHSVSPYPNLHA